MNKLFNQLNSNNNSYNLNPQKMLMNMANKNPRIAQVLQEVKANGGDAKSLFYRKAQQMGVDPESILKQLR